MRRDSQGRLLRSVTLAGQGQVSAVAESFPGAKNGFPFVEDEAGADDRRAFRRVADREGDVLVHRVERADDVDGFAGGVGERDHRGNVLEGFDVEDRRSGTRQGGTGGCHDGEVVDSNERVGGAGQDFRFCLCQAALGKSFRVDAQAFWRFDDDVVDSTVGSPGGVVEREIGDPEIGMAGRLGEPFVRSACKALFPRLGERERANDGWPAQQWRINVFFARQRFPFFDAERGLGTGCAKCENKECGGQHQQPDWASRTSHMRISSTTGFQKLNYPPPVVENGTPWSRRAP